MREVSPGDTIFSFVDTRIAAIGVAESYCWESPKPAEFGEAGQNWENVGWKIKVRFAPLFNRVRPKDHIAVLRGVLPGRYSPLQANGNGVQSIYLTEIASGFAEVLAGLVGAEARPFVSAAEVNSVGTSDRMMTSDDLDVWERRLEEKVASDPSLVETDREAIIRARRGQGLFKQRVMQIERRCRITAVDNAIHLVASHCKPWRDSGNEERLDGENERVEQRRTAPPMLRGYV
jgi:putative restriction endonuclease